MIAKVLGDCEKGAVEGLRKDESIHLRPIYAFTNYAVACTIVSWDILDNRREES
jgi:hypothetical protein